jgi:hypothetical protein
VRCKTCSSGICSFTQPVAPKPAPSPRLLVVLGQARSLFAMEEEDSKASILEEMIGSLEEYMEM